MTTASQVVASRWWPNWPASLSVSTEMIDPLEVGERVAAGGDLLLDPLDAGRVEPHQRDREPGPQLPLELLQHLLRRDDQDPVAPAPADQLGEDQPDLQGLAEADHVGEQDPRPQAATAPAPPDAAGRSAGRAGTGRPAPGRARYCGSGVRRSTASRKSRLCRNRDEVSRTSTVSSGRIAWMSSSAVKKVASTSCTNSETPTALIMVPSAVPVLTLRTSHSSSRTTMREPGANVASWEGGHRWSLPTGSSGGRTGGGSCRPASVTSGRESGRPLRIDLGRRQLRRRARCRRSTTVVPSGSCCGSCRSGGTSSSVSAS